MRRSPFPGMDPYLEDAAFWGDFHTDLLISLRSQLLTRLPNGYDARVNMHTQMLTVGADDDDTIYPDVRVMREIGTPPPEPADGGSVATLPARVYAFPTHTEVKERVIEVRRLPGMEVVTLIELLSPANKSGTGHDHYDGKRVRIVASGVNLVELDLLTGGRRLRVKGRLHPADYYAFVERAGTRKAEVYAWDVEHPLPTVPVPLKAPARDVPLDLAAAFAEAFDRGRYTRLRYGQPPPGRWADPKRDWVVATSAAAAPAPPAGPTA